MNTRTPLVIGVSFLVISLLSAGLARWQAGVHSQSSISDVQWPDTEELVTIDVEWPRAMHTNESAWVTISLAPKARSQIPDFANVSGDESQDEVVVTASLVTTSFDLKNVLAEPLSVRGRARVSWLWVITPKYTGHQALGALLYIERRMKGSGALRDRRFLHGAGAEIVVKDQSTVAQLEGLLLITGAVGLLLSLLRPLEAIIRRIEARSKRQSGSE